MKSRVCDITFQSSVCAIDSLGNVHRRSPRLAASHLKAGTCGRSVGGSPHRKCPPCGLSCVLSQRTPAASCRVGLLACSIGKGGSTMPRPAKPYLERNWYISRPGGESIRLCHRSEGYAKATRYHVPSLTWPSSPWPAKSEQTITSKVYGSQAWAPH